MTKKSVANDRSEDRLHQFNPLTVIAILLIILGIFIIWFWIIIQASPGPVTDIGRIRDEENVVLGEAEWILESNNRNSQYYMAVNNPPGDIIQGGFYLRVDNDWSLLKTVVFRQRGTSVLWTAVGEWDSTDPEQPLTGAIVDQLYAGNVYARAITEEQALAGQMQVITDIE